MSSLSSTFPSFSLSMATVGPCPCHQHARGCRREEALGLSRAGFRRAAAPSAWVVVVLPSSAARHLKVAVAGDEDQWEVGAATDLLPIPLDDHQKGLPVPLS
uniref:Uncharacterized protein n=1 Tax=Triticum urartu TaxID=4572 RepID=A0A8R7U7I0_TRIUA